MSQVGCNKLVKVKMNNEGSCSVLGCFLPFFAPLQTHDLGVVQAAQKICVCESILEQKGFLISFTVCFCLGSRFQIDDSSFNLNLILVLSLISLSYKR